MLFRRVPPCMVAKQAHNASQQPSMRPAASVPSRHGVIIRAASRSGNNKPRVCVLGAGVVGLTSALRLLQSLGDRVRCVDIIADRIGVQTTSNGAAGLWGPYKLSDTSPSCLAAWGGETFEHLHNLYHTSEAMAAGVSLVSVYELWDHPAPDLAWAKSLLHYQHLNAKELARYGPQYVHGLFYRAPVCEGRWYLPWLAGKIRELGGGLLPDSQWRPRTVASLQELQGAYDVVVNCTGMGAKQLVKDAACYPIRGQIMRVRAPWVREAYFAGESYIIPNRDSVVIGGTGQVGDYNTEPSAEDRERILEGVYKVMPSLRHAEVLSEWVGLRPGRTQLRLELEELELEGAGSKPGAGSTVQVIHNYGHGGGGLSIAWGCAGDVVRIATGLL